MKRILFLAGTGEARQLADMLAGEAGLHVTASLAGATLRPKPLGVPTRIGGFGGAAGFREYLIADGIDAVLDATHPYAAQISHRSFKVAAELGLPYLLLLRPPWQSHAGDNWVTLSTENEAVRHIPEAARVFLATGGQSVAQWGALEGRTVFLRVMDPPADAFPFEQGRFIVGAPKASAMDEQRLMEELRIDWLVTKNSGGAKGRAKLDAARMLGIPVAMLRRPIQPDAPQTSSLEEALDWARHGS